MTLLSRTNQLLVRATNERELLRDLCSAIAGYGGYKLVWVGKLDKAGDKSLDVRARGGQDVDILENTSVDWLSGDGETSPVAKSIESEALVTSVINDVSGTPTWKRVVDSKGHEKISCFPLNCDGSLYGVLTIHTDNEEDLDRRELSLLSDLVEDLIFGIETLRERERRRFMEEELKQLSGHLLRARESERERISRELHDELGQLTTSVIIGLSSLKDRNSIKDDSEAKRKLEEVNGIVEKLDEKLRDMAKDIRPPSLKELGLVPTLKSYLDDVSSGNDISIKLDFDDPGDFLDLEAKVQIFRVIQEAVTNSVRHGMPSRIWVSLKKKEDYLRATISDDGTGFEPENVWKEGGNEARLGLIGMRERARSISGHLTVKSSPGNGTTISLKLPFEETDELD